MSLISIANQFYRQIKLATSDNYKKLLKAQELAQAAAIDPYGEFSPEEKKSLQNLLRMISSLTDKAYRSGIDASSLKYTVENAKSIAFKLNLASQSETVKKDLTSLIAALQEIQMIDIPSQMAGNTAQVMPEDKITGTPAAKPKTPQQQVGMTPEMEDVVSGLVNKNHPTDFDTKPLKWP